MPDPLAGGERRSLTVLVLDIVESTTLSSSLDPEDFAEIIERLGAIWRASVEAVDGRILKWTGDGILAVFGYPRAHENAAVRAVEAAQDLLTATDAERQSGRVTPSVRIGVHTGLTLIHQVGDGPEEFDIVGDTPAIATRLQALAPSNGVYVSAATAQRLGQEFDLERVGEQELRGVPEPVEVFRVLRRSDTVLTLGTEPLVGRDAELATLLERWARAREGEPQAILLCAAPGIGKTRLINELIARTRAEGHTYVLRCSELMQTTSLFPVIRGVRSLVRWTRDGDPEVLRTRLGAEFGKLGVQGAPDLVAGMLGVEAADPDALPIEPAMRRAQLLAALVTWIEQRATNEPECFVVEDLHWADPSTIELLCMLRSHLEGQRLLIVLSTRPEGLARLGPLAGVERLDLGPLAPAAATELIEQIAGGPVPDAFRLALLERSDAVPLFVTELTRAVVQTGLLADGAEGPDARRRLEQADVPLSLADTLLMRLDGLGPSRGAASAAATIGRTFDKALLTAVTPRPETLEQDVTTMLEAGVLTVNEAADGRLDYAFSHALLRDAAYASLTRGARRELHAKVASHIGRHGDDSEPAVLAHHYTEAGQTELAVATWGEAGRASFAVAAYDESLANFRRGLVLVESLTGDTASRLELPLQIGIGITSQTRLGYTSEDAEVAFRRANDLAATADGAESFEALIGLWQYYQVRSDRELRRSLGERCNELAQLSDDPAVRLEGLSALSTTLAFEGEFGRALAIMDEGIALFDAEGHAEMSYVLSQDPVAGFYAISAPILWSTGQFRKSRAYYDALQEYAEHPAGVLGPFTSGYAHAFSAWICLHRGDPATAATHATKAMEIGTTHGFLVWIGVGYPLLGIATAQLGDPATGIQMTTDGIAAWRGAGAELQVSYFQLGLALCHEAAGDPEAALQSVEAGLEHGATHAERLNLAELHRLRGRLLAGAGDDAAASVDRRAAASIARGQGALALEALALTDIVAAGDATGDDATRLEALVGRLETEDDGSESVRSILDAASALRAAGGAGS